jgi:hypothetical protein
MSSEEQRLAELLKRTVPEPPLELSADRVTVLHADQSRRSWLVPALAAASIVVVAGAGAGLSAVHGSAAKSASSSVAAAASGQRHAPTASATAAAVVAPTSFNPLELPANFGWLPKGFTENQPAPDQFPMAQGPLEVTPTQASFGASIVTDGGNNQEGFQVTVGARGVNVNPWVGGGTGNSAEFKVTGTAPDINGRPAKWLVGGVEWEYANGAWATIVTGGAGTQAAKEGWGQSCTTDAPAQTGNTPVQVTPSMVKCSPMPRQSAQLHALLEKVASNIKFTPIPFTFPYEFTKALPQGLTVGDVNGSFVNGRLTAGELDLNVAGVTGKQSSGDVENMIMVQAWSDPSSHSYCPAMAGAYFDTINGVKWQIQSVKGSKPDYESSATACSGAPVSAKNGSAGLGFDDYSATSFQIGFADEKALLPILKFLPANPADWTTSPIPN